MNTLYRTSNWIVGIISAVVLGGAGSVWVANTYEKADQIGPAAGIALGMLAIIVGGWFAIESRKY